MANATCYKGYCDYTNSENKEYGRRLDSGEAVSLAIIAAVVLLTIASAFLADATIGTEFIDGLPFMAF